MDTAIHSDKECGVCYMQYSDNHNAVALRCGHVFGEECAVEWINNRHNCPMCKVHAKKNQLLRLYNTPRLPRQKKSKGTPTPDEDPSKNRVKELRDKLKVRKNRIRELREENAKLKLKLVREKALRGDENREMSKLRDRMRYLVSTIARISDKLVETVEDTEFMEELDIDNYDYEN